MKHLHRFNDRYDYIVWIVKQMGQLQVSSETEDETRVFKIVRLELGIKLIKRAQSKIKETFVRRLYSRYPGKKGRPIFAVNWLPNGFKSVGRRGRLRHPSGLANVSVFLLESRNSDLAQQLQVRVEQSC